eukprot:TRINITY_DN975_c0_g1_i3.p2 TRINITY_DN975_c0_g1~~TRINITY_DN975_c0_g1_i3.p2  ORF type:complete len:159 (-),score=30.54 TRINITY_DN975_c0_g1_i3:96-572(-)
MNTQLKARMKDASISGTSNNRSSSKYQYLRSLSKQYQSKCNECRSKDKFISALQTELARLQTLTNDFSFQLIARGSKPDSLVKAPQTEPNYKSCVYCRSKLLKITPYRLKVLFCSPRKSDSPSLNSVRLNPASSLVLSSQNELMHKSEATSSFHEFAY